MDMVIDILKGFSFAWVDAVVIFVVLVCVILGFKTGFIWQVVRLASVVLAYWAAAHFHEPVAARLGPEIGKSARMGICYVAVFLGALLVAYLVAFVVRRPIDALKPQKIDRVLGAIVGAAKGLLICGILALGVLRFGDEKAAVRGAVKWSPSASVAVQCTRALWFGMPEKE